MKPMSKVALWAIHLRVAEEVQDLLGDLGEERLVLQEFIGDAMDGQRVRMDLLVARVDVDVQRPAGREMVDQLDAADFDDAVGAVVEAGGFRIEDDFTHSGILRGLFAVFRSATISRDLLPRRCRCCARYQSM